MQRIARLPYFCAAFTILAALTFAPSLWFPHSASAAEHSFCTGVVLKSYNASCGDSQKRWIDAVYGTGANGAICAGAQNGPISCTHDPGEGVYVNVEDGPTFDTAVIINFHSGKNKVYGTVWDSPEPSGWHGEDFGGSISSDPEISSWGPGRLDIFARGTDNALWHKWWDGSNWNGWESLGGTLASGPGAVSWGKDRIDVVARASDNTVLHWWWNGSWHVENMGGSITWDPDISSWGTNRLDIWGRSPNGSIAHKWWNGSSWSEWQTLGEAGSIVSGVGAAGYGGNRIDVVGRSTKDSVFHLWWNGSAWKTEDLGGTIVSDPDISIRDSGAFDLWARGTDDYLWHKWWVGSWSSWEKVSVAYQGLASSPGAVSWDSKRIDVVGRDSDNSVKHWWWTSP